MRLPVNQCVLDVVRRRCWLASKDCGIEVEQREDEFRAAAADELILKIHPGVAEQPWLTQEAADERCQVAILNGAADLLHDKRLPQSNRSRVPGDRPDVFCPRFDKGLDEAEASHASIDFCPELGIERNGSFQQQ